MIEITADNEIESKEFESSAHIQCFRFTNHLRNRFNYRMQMQ